MTKEKKFKKRKLWQKIIICLLLIILIIVLGFSALIGYLTLTEFNPDKEVPLKLTGKSQTEAVYKSKELTAVSWNIGYGALGSDADFFMDGGKSVDTADKDGVNKNLKGISSELNSLNPDFILLQEVDTDAKRSSYINEASKLQSELLNQDYQSSFAENFKVKFIPYPIPPIGKVNAGIMTLSKSKISEATRVQLPCPFKWPTRVANLKRCLSINRLPIEGSDKELVIVNLHLEAYDDGDGKKAQAEMLRKYLQAEADKGNYVIAGGDFNQTFSGADTSIIKQFNGTWKPPVLDTDKFDKSWQFLMDTKTASCRSLDKPLTSLNTNKFQFYIIDGFIVSSNIEVTSLETKQMGFKNTDHNPVVLKFKLK